MKLTTTIHSTARRRYNKHRLLTKRPRRHNAALLITARRDAHAHGTHAHARTRPLGTHNTHAWHGAHTHAHGLLARTTRMHGTHTLARQAHAHDARTARRAHTRLARSAHARTRMRVNGTYMARTWLLDTRARTRHGTHTTSRNTARHAHGF